MTKSLHDPIKLKITHALMKAIKEQFSHELTEVEIYSLLVSPPQFAMGHLAFGCFPLAKALRLGPPVIAQKLAALEELINLPFLAKLEPQGPYLNFKIKTEFLAQEIIAPLLDGSYFKRQLTAPSKIMIEYSQPNTHKELHVGHMRNLCLGNAIVRLNRMIGFDVHAVTYPGDVGTHVAKCLWYMLKFTDGKPPKTGHPGAWLGSLYSKAHILLEDQLGSPNEEKNRAELTAILKELHDQKGPYFDLWKETREWSIDLMQKAYTWADVSFDEWFWESQMDAPSLEFAKVLYKQGKLELSEGAIGMNLEEDKLGFCMLIKTDGTGLYATKDIMLAKRKFEQHQLNKNIYVVDKRQALHFKQVFKVLEKIGFEKAQDCFHLQYDFVELPDGAMSSRKGNIVALMDLINSMEETIKNEYLSRYKDEWTQEQINQTATMVANGAIKYGMIRMDNNRKIVFDMKDWLKLEGETGPYLQYVHARICSLLEKFDSTDKVTDWSLLSHTAEQELLWFLNQYNSVLLESALQYRPPLMCSYLYDLGKLFNSFYAECSIGKESNPQIKAARLHLTRAVKIVMARGLESLGIPAPLRM